MPFAHACRRRVAASLACLATIAIATATAAAAARVPPGLVPARDDSAPGVRPPGREPLAATAAAAIGARGRDACGTGVESASDLVARHLARGPVSARPTTWTADLGEIAVVEDDGTFFFSTPDGHPSLDFAQVTRAFYRTHGDDYDGLAIYLPSGQSMWLGIPTALAAAFLLRNDVAGIGLDAFDVGEAFASPARLKALFGMNGLHRYLDDPNAPTGIDEFTPLDFLGHEFAHLFSSYVWVDSAGVVVPALLGRSYQHWNFFADVDGSVMEGCDWIEVGPDSFHTTAVTTGYGRLDLYLMGLMSKAEVGAVRVVNDPAAFDPPDIYVPYSYPNPDVGCRGRATHWTVDDIEAVHGPRVPAAGSAPTSWRLGFVLVVPHGVPPTPEDLAKLEAIRSGFGPWFASATGGRGTVDCSLESRHGIAHIGHAPLRDFEDVGAARRVAARVWVEPAGLPTALAPSGPILHRRLNGGSWIDAPLAAAGADSFEAWLPAPGAPGTVEYWIEALTDVPGAGAWDPPAGPAAPHAFAVGPDLTAPTVRHVPLPEQAVARMPQTLLARVTDNLGVDSVWVERSVLGGPLGSVAASKAGADSFSVALGQGLAEGGWVAYRFVARDRAAAPNLGWSDPGFDTLRAGRIEVFDVENGADGWVHLPYWWSYRDAWHPSQAWAAAPGGTSWHCGSSDGTPYPPHLDANLYPPEIAAFVPGTMLTFEHGYDLEEASNGYAWDGARVEVSVAGGAWQIALPAGGYSHALRKNVNPFQRDTPCWSGSAGPRAEAVDLSPYAPGPVRVRFRMLADDFIGGDGWHVDRVRVIPPGEPVAVGADGWPGVSGVPHPNPARAGVRVALALPATAEVEWSLFDLQGRRVAQLWSGRAQAGARSLDAVLPPALPPGLYFSRLSLDGRRAAATRLAVVR